MGFEAMTRLPSLYFVQLKSRIHVFAAARNDSVQMLIFNLLKFGPVSMEAGGESYHNNERCFVSQSAVLLIQPPILGRDWRLSVSCLLVVQWQRTHLI